MKKVISLIIFIITLFLSLNKTLAYYDLSDTHISTFKTDKYVININPNGGIFSDTEVVIKDNKITLPLPTKTGYTFVGYNNSNNENISYKTDIENIAKINNNNIVAKWDINNYIVDINTMIDETVYSSGLIGHTFDVFINDELVADDVINFCQNIEYGSSIRVKTNNTTGRTTNYDKSFILGASQLNINPTWTSNVYEGHFYLNGVHRLTTYNKYGNTVATPNTNAGSLGYDSNFYYISGYSPWTTWIQPDYAVGFSINIAEYNCTASFGSSNTTNVLFQLNKIQNTGYGFCHDGGWGAVECTSNYSNVIGLYNNIWNILPKSGSGYSIYKQMSCTSGWSTVQRR